MFLVSTYNRTGTMCMCEDTLYTSHRLCSTAGPGGRRASIRAREILWFGSTPPYRPMSSSLLWHRTHISCLYNWIIMSVRCACSMMWGQGHDMLCFCVKNVFGSSRAPSLGVHMRETRLRYLPNIHWIVIHTPAVHACGTAKWLSLLVTSVRAEVD
jgi:hypothetical protein